MAHIRRQAASAERRQRTGSAGSPARRRAWRFRCLQKRTSRHVHPRIQDKWRSLIARGSAIITETKKERKVSSIVTGSLSEKVWATRCLFSIRPAEIAGKALPEPRDVLEIKGLGPAPALFSTPQPARAGRPRPASKWLDRPAGDGFISTMMLTKRSTGITASSRRTIFATNVSPPSYFCNQTGLNRSFPSAGRRNPLTFWLVAA